jgi:EpsG family
MSELNKPWAPSSDLTIYLILLSILLYFIGLRDVEVGSDTAAYFKYFDYIKYGEDFEGAERIEIGFYWLTQVIAYFTDSKNAYLAVIFFIQFVGITSAFNKKSELFKPYILLTLVWLSYPFFYSITLNVIRQGLAFVFVIYAVDAKLQQKKYAPYFFLLLGATFHYATFLYVISFLLLALKVTTKRMVLLWFACAICAGIGLTQEFISWLFTAALGNSPYFMSYLDSSVNNEYDVSFRFHFVVFSALPIGYYYLTQQFVAEEQGNTFIFRLYLAMNTLYLFTISLPYSDRFALASWLLIPFLINLNFLYEIQAQKIFAAIVSILSVVVFSYYLLF